MLTYRQNELLLYIAKHLQEVGIYPSIDEMRRSLDLKSKSGIHRILIALQERGFIRKIKNRARAIEIIKLPPSLYLQSFAKFEVIEGNLGKTNYNSKMCQNDDSLAPNGTAYVPVMGSISAGTPAETIEKHISTIAVPCEMLESGSHYALQVKGSSMIKQGILEGDIVVIKKTFHANNGDIIIALIKNKDAFIKKIRKKGETIALEPANDKYETRIYKKQDVTIKGKMVGLLRCL